MAKIKISSGQTQVSVNLADTTYILEKGETVQASMTSLISNGTAEGTRFQLDGKLTAMGGDGLEWGTTLSGGTATHVEIGKSGRIDVTGAGLRLHGDGQYAENAGRIDGAQGIILDGSDGTVKNSGHIEASGAGVVATGDATVINTGTIEGTLSAVTLKNGEFDTGSTVKNFGRIEGDIALLGTTVDDKVINAGKMIGDIKLGEGDDTFVFQAGSKTSTVQGGDGDDHYVIHDKGADIFETFLMGYDIVKSSVSYTISDNIEEIILTGKADINATGNIKGNRVEGNAGNNVLHGDDGLDFLGGAGNDKLFGDQGSDTFSFVKGTGRDTVMDFELMIDSVDLSTLKGATDFDNLMNKHVEQKGADVLITFGHDTMVLKNVDADQLQADYFTF